MENKSKKRPHDVAWRGSHMESKSLRGREIPEKRTQNSKIFDLGRGAFQYVQYPDSVHFKDSNGNWQEIDNHLSEQKNADGKPVLRNRTNALCVEMAQQTGEAPLVAICNAAGQALAWELRGAQTGIPAQINVPEGDTVVDEDDKRADMSRVEASLIYEEILPHVDVICRLQGTAFKDDIVLKDAQAPHRVVFDLTASGVDLVFRRMALLSLIPPASLSRSPLPFPPHSCGTAKAISARSPRS